MQGKSLTIYLVDILVMCYITAPRHVGPLFDRLVPFKVAALAFISEEIPPSTSPPPRDSRPKSQYWGPNFILENKIPALRPGSLSPLCSRSPAPPLNFNHNLLRQSSGTADHLTILRLFTFWAAAPKGSMTYAFTHMGDFLLHLLLRPPPSNPSLEA